MNWIKLQTTQGLSDLVKSSKDQPVIIFKHSTRCPISSMALNRLERDWDSTLISEKDAYYLDIITFRDISNAIASDLNVPHESPQLIVLFDGKPVFDTSHMSISFETLKEALQNVKS